MELQQHHAIDDLGIMEKRMYKVKNADIFSLRDERPVLTKSQRQPILLKIEQISDKNRDDEVSITADRKAFPYISLDHKGINIVVNVSEPGDVEELSKKIVISLALKKYAKIVTSGCINSSFSSQIRVDKLLIDSAGESCIQMPSINAGEIDMYVKDTVKVTMQNNALLTAKVIAIDRKGNAHMDLSVDTPLLDVRNNGDGQLIIKGVADEQRLHLKEGSYRAFGLDSDRICAMINADLGIIELRANKLITGTVARYTQHKIRYCSPYECPIQMYSADYLIKEFSDYYNNYSEVDFLREQVYQFLLTINKTIAFKISELLFLISKR